MVQGLLRRTMYDQETMVLISYDVHKNNCKRLGQTSSSSIALYLWYVFLVHPDVKLATKHPGLNCTVIILPQTNDIQITLLMNDILAFLIILLLIIFSLSLFSLSLWWLWRVFRSFDCSPFSSWKHPRMSNPKRSISHNV